MRFKLLLVSFFSFFFGLPTLGHSSILHRRFVPSRPVIVNHHNVVIREIVAVPVIVPAYTFQYAPPCYTPALPHAAAPVVPGFPHLPAAPIPHGPPITSHAPPMTSPVNPTPPAIGSNDQIRALARALLEEMQKFSDNDSGPPSVPTPGSVPPAPIGLNPTPPPSTLTREQAAPIAIAALNRSCSACHTGIGSKGDVVIFSQPGVLNQDAPWRGIIKEIEAGRMPPRYSPFTVSREEFIAIKTWLTGS